MTDETAEQVLTRVLGEHWEYGPTAEFDGWECGCGKRISNTSDGVLDEDMQAHVAAELAAALREAGLLPEGETVTEEMYASPDLKRLASVKYVRAGHIDPTGMRLLSRQRTRYPDRVTDWEEVR